MAIDAATRDSLELTRSVGGSVAGSLLGEIDRCQTAAGRRLLCEDISAPLTDRSAIEQRLALVAWLNEDALRRERVRSALKAMPDFARALARLAAGRGSPRDLALLRDGLAGAAALRDRAGDRKPNARRLLDELLPRLGGHAALVDRLRVAHRRIAADRRVEGRLYRGRLRSPRSTRLREAASNGRRAIAALEARYRDSTGIGSLKIRHNAVLGYHVEVSAKHADRLMAPDSGFTHRQTLAGVVRFNSPELHEEASRVVEAGAHALAAEAAHAEELTAAGASPARRRSPRPPTPSPASTSPQAMPSARRKAAGALPAAHRRSRASRSKAGRHPVVEAALQQAGERFVANDLSIGHERPAVADHRARTWAASRPSCGRPR